MHQSRIAAFNKNRIMTKAAQHRVKFVVANAGENRGVGDLVAIEMEDREHRAIARGIEEFVGVPRGSEWPGFGLAIANHASGDQIRIVKHCAVGVRQGIAQLAAFMD